MAGLLMAAAVVDRLCAPTALALKQAGLEYLLFDEAQAQAMRNSVRAATRQSEASGVRTSVFYASPAARSPAHDAREIRGSQAAPVGSSRSEAAVPQAAPDPADWPVDWQECLKKTRVTPVVWTYWELGRDLYGTPDPQRREFLQELLQHLAHPPGTHSFWPLALPSRSGDGEQELVANTPVFWEGVKLLRSRAVLIMGSQALRSLALPDHMLALRPFQQVRHQGKLLIVLHSPDMLIRESQRMHALREFLRQALAPFA